MNPERSTELFKFVQDCDVPLSIDDVESLTDENFNLFVEKYRSWALKRDEYLTEYLKRTTSNFRVYLPYNSRVFNLAYRVLWYLDEIILRDPILYTLLPMNNPIPTDVKGELIKIVRLLMHFRDSIESGYILFAGDSVLIKEDSIKKEDVELVLQNESVRLALEDSVKFGHLIRKDNFGNDWNVYQVFLETGGMFNMKPVRELNVEAGQTIVTPFIKLGEILPSITKEEVIKITKGSIIEDISSIFPIEITHILLHVERARNLSSAVMFDRNLPHAVLSEIYRPILQSSKQRTSVLGFNLTLPYLEGIPSHKLLELREEIPESFEVFRLKMNEIIKETLISSNQNLNDELKMNIDQEVIPQLRTLDADMKAIGKKVRIFGIGAPTVACFATLIGASLLFPPAALGTVLGGGTIAGLKTISDGEAEKTKLTSNPFYFIWKAKNRI